MRESCAAHAEVHPWEKVENLDHPDLLFRHYDLVADFFNRNLFRKIVQYNPS